LRLTACGLPIRPHGRKTSTTAITRNSTTSVSFEKAKPTPNKSTVPMPMQIALISAISKAATYAPGIEPMPPTTTTTNASPIVARSSPRFAGSRGNCNAPPRPASIVPSANTPVNSHAWLTPSALTISRSWVAARTSVPQRVFVSSSQSPPSTSGPTAIRNRSYVGKRRPRMSTAPERPGARGPSRSSGPQTHNAASLITSISAKVASSWNNSGARYTRRSSMISTTAPITPTASDASNSDGQNHMPPPSCSASM